MAATSRKTLNRNGLDTQSGSGWIITRLSPKQSGQTKANVVFISAGRPHSSDLKVEETFHRADADTLELSVMIEDPKMYTKPWMALNKLKFYLRPVDFDVREMMCSPSELEEYDKFLGNPASNK